MKIISRLIDITLISLICLTSTLFFLNHQNSLSKDQINLQKEVTKEEVTKESAFDISVFSNKINEISEKAERSILWINSNDTEDSFGSGFVIEHNGDKYVLTNHHVVENSEDITAFLYNDEEVNLTLVGYDIDLDLAVLSFEKKNNLPPLKLENSKNVKVGDFTLAIGHPLGLDYSTTFGIVSALNRELSLESVSFSNLIQTDAAINPGNSGGPLFNFDGNVIGINTAVMEDSQGLGFAVATTDIVKILDTLIENGSVERPFIGVSILDSEKGVVVLGTFENSPAEKAGFLENDIIIDIEGKSINSVEELTETINSYKVGSKLKVKLKRNGNLIIKELVLGDKNDILKN